MDFLTFITYFFISHLVYTLVLAIIGEIVRFYQRKTYQKTFQDMLNNGQIQVLELDQSGDDNQWH